MLKHSLAPMAIHRKGFPRVFWGVGLLMCVCFFVLMPTDSNTVHAVAISDSATLKPAAASAASSKPVELTLYVMSQCPDAKFCEKAFKPVLETLPTVATVRTEYIASLSGETEEEVQCMHGTAECDGNKHQLCLQHHLPAADNRKFFQALLCHSKGHVNDVTHLQTCMKEVGVDASAQAEVLKCIDSTLGTSLQVKSAKQVKANSVVKSCTVYIDGVKRCIRDGGRWYDCPGGSETQDFINSICDAHKTKAGGKAAAECAAAVGQASAAA